MIISRISKVNDNSNCVLCTQQIYDNWSHLFFKCTFSSRVWNYLHVECDDDTILASLKRAKDNFDGPCFSEVVILACWNICKQRNCFIFEGITPTFRRWKAVFLLDTSLLRHRVKASVLETLSSWLNSMP